MSLPLEIAAWTVIHVPAIAEALQQLVQVAAAGAIQADRRRRRRLGLDQGVADDDLLPPISIVAPALNEEVGIATSVGSLLALDYPDYEVVVVEDGSRDDTFGVLQRAYGLVPAQVHAEPGLDHRPIASAWRSPRDPRLLVVRKENGGCKADANNAGLAVARNPLVCMVDCDSLLERDALRLAAAPFCRDPAGIAAVGGQIRVLNGCLVHAGFLERTGLPRHPLALAQVGEYLRAFMAFRVVWSRWGALPLISGAFGLFRRDAVVEVGGYDTRSLGEDMDLVMRIHAEAPARRAAGSPWRVVHVPEAACWTEVPVRLRDLGRQRVRWQRGLLETLRDRRGMLLRPRHGLVGMVVLPMFWLVDGLGPVATLAGLAALPLLVLGGSLPAWHLDLFLATTLAIGLLTSLLAVSVEVRSGGAYRGPAQAAVLCAAALAENLGYRQLNAWWRIRGTIDHLLGRGRRWDSLARTGAAAPVAAGSMSQMLDERRIRDAARRGGEGDG